MRFLKNMALFTAMTLIFESAASGIAVNAGEVAHIQTPAPSISYNKISYEAAEKWDEMLADRSVTGYIFHGAFEDFRAGESVKIIEPVTTQEGFYYFRIEDGEGKKTTMIPRGKIAVADERLLEWESAYVPDSAKIYDTPEMLSVGADWTDFQSSLLADSGVSDFPESYKSALETLSKAHPEWKFAVYDTGVKWEDAVEAELKDDRSYIEQNADEQYIDKNNQKGSGWYLASRAGVEHYMDPRTYLDEKHIFAFEAQTFNESYQTESVVQKLLQNTFMSGNIPETQQTYANAFCEIGSDSNIKASPIFLAARVKQEQGIKGTSDLISGKYSGHEGYYNYFNIQATGTGEQAVVNGLKYASGSGDYERPWDTRYKSIKGGAKYVAEQYIGRGQDTLYFQKYNIVSAPYYNHQYMQNVRAPYNEAASMYAGYSGADILSTAFVFRIPVFTGMPGGSDNDTSVIDGNEAGISNGEQEDAACTVNYYDAKGQLAGTVTALSGISLSQLPEIFTPPSQIQGKVFAGYFSDTAGRGLKLEADTCLQSDISVYQVYITLQNGYTVLPAGGYYYTGRQIRPVVSVYDGTKPLTSGVDYNITYKYNKNVPTNGKSPVIVIKGIGGYRGSKIVNFNILPTRLNCSRARVKYASAVFNGKPVKISPAVYYDGKALKKGKDYEVLSNGAINGEGEYAVKIKGTNNFIGDIDTKLVVSKAVNINTCQVKKRRMTYSGSPQKPSITVTYKKQSLQEGIHYRLICPSDMTNAGEKIIYIEGLASGGYFGIKAVNVNLSGGSLKGCRFEGVSGVNFINDGIYRKYEINNLTVTDKEGTRLKEGIDYTAAYTDNDRPGSATIVITGINRYSGSASKKFRIIGPALPKMKNAEKKLIS